MAREIRKDKLAMAVKKTSGPMQCRINKYWEKWNLLEEEYANSSSRADLETEKKLAVALGKMETVREIFEFAGNFDREKQLASSAGRAKLRAFSRTKRNGILNYEDAMCALAKDKALHLVFLLEFEKRGGRLD